MENLATIATLALSVLAAIGSAYAYLDGRRRRKALLELRGIQAEGEKIDTVVTLSARR
jgi:hypothetical protein